MSASSSSSGTNDDDGDDDAPADSGGGLRAQLHDNTAAKAIKAADKIATYTMDGRMNRDSGHAMVAVRLSRAFDKTNNIETHAGSPANGIAHVTRDACVQIYVRSLYKIYYVVNIIYITCLYPEYSPW